MADITFKDAFVRLQEINKELEKEEVIDIEKLTKLQKEASELYEIANSKLTKVK